MAFGQELRKLASQVKRTELNTSQMEEEEKAQAIKELEAQEQETENQTMLEEHAATMAGYLDKRVANLGIKVADVPALASIIEEWRQAPGQEEINDLFLRAMGVLDGHQGIKVAAVSARIKALEKELTDLKAGKQVETKPNGKMAVGAGVAPGAGGLSRQELVNRMGRGDYMTSAEMATASKAMNEGIYPKF